MTLLNQIQALRNIKFQEDRPCFANLSLICSTSFEEWNVGSNSIPLCLIIEYQRVSRAPSTVQAPYFFFRTHGIVCTTFLFLFCNICNSVRIKTLFSWFARQTSVFACTKWVSLVCQIPHPALLNLSNQSKVSSP